MELILKGKDCGFTFSASHLLPGHYKCSRMHGHNYVLDLEIYNNSNNLKNGIMYDFVIIKKIIREFLEEYDHKLLLPAYSTTMIINENDIPELGSEYLRITYEITEIGELDEQTGIPIYDKDSGNLIRFVNKNYIIPKMDTVILPIYYTTAEELVWYFRKKIFEILSKKFDKQIFLPDLTVTLYEDDGQGVKF